MCNSPPHFTITSTITATSTFGFASKARWTRVYRAPIPQRREGSVVEWARSAGDEQGMATGLMIH